MPNGDPKFHQGNFEGTVLADLLYIKEQLKSKVDRAEFLPVKTIAFGTVGLILTAVMGAILAGVVKALTIITP